MLEIVLATFLFYFPIVQSILSKFQNIDQILNSQINEGGKMHTKSHKFTKPVGPHYNVLTEKIAIDCEMMRFNIGQVLGRVSVVNYEGETIFDTFVCYPSPSASQTPTKSFPESTGTTSIRRTALNLFLKFRFIWSSFFAIAL